MTVMHDVHEENCRCSYCSSTYSYKKLHYGLNIPKDWKTHNAWWVIKYWPNRYFRWTNSWLRTFKR